MNKHRVFKAITIFLVLFAFGFTLVHPSQASQGLLRSHQVDDPGVRTDYHDETGKLSFLGASPDSPIMVQAALGEGLSPEDRAMAVLNEYGSDFGLKNPAQELRLLRVSTSNKGRSSIRFQQVFEGVPVLAGELIVNQDDKGQLLSISGEISPDLSISNEPTITGGSAKQTAQGAVAKYYGLNVGDLSVTDPELWVFDERLLKPSARPATLVWRMEVSGTERLEIRELVLVDAYFGAIVLHFNQIDTARNRETYDANNGTVLPGTLVCNESDPTCSGAGGDQHAIKAHEYAGDTYDYFWIEHGRDSINNAGMTLVSTVHYGSGYANAFWSGSQMVYGDAYGFALADDVVAHELSHGVTDYTSHMFYFYQSGAMNEAMSDIFGEFTDLTNGAGNDTPGVRWLMGEDVSGLGAIRDMSNPPAFGDPDKITSANFVCSTSDNGGVHSNSGVANKAAFLLTDGGSFNGYVVTGMGISKVSDLFYEADSNLLTSGSNFNDLYNALIQASYTVGLSAAERQEVEDAIDATEMDIRPCGDPVEAPVCTGGLNPINMFFDDLENTGSGNWTSYSDVGPNEWYYPQNTNPYGFDATNTSSGIYNFWGYDVETTADYSIAMTSDITIPSQAYLHFKHYWDFEDFYDGGVVEYSTNGGGSWFDAGSLFTHNGYTDTISACCGNPIGGQQAFAYESRGYTSSRLDLSSLAGQSVRFRFRIGTDASFWDYGWFIDDIRIYRCASGMNPPGDFDEDGMSDIGFFRGPAPGLWGILHSGDAFSSSFAQWASWGQAGDVPVLGDYDGDGKTDFVVRRPPAGGQSAALLVLKSTTGYDYGKTLIIPAGWPSLGDTPVPADYDGDGKTDAAVWRESNGVWIIPLSGGNYSTYQFANWGVSGDSPVGADVDGDGMADIGFYRASSGLWGFLKSSSGYSTGDPQWFSWGGPTDTPVMEDYDGDGLADPAFVTPPAGGQSAAYRILLSSTQYDYGQTLTIPAGWPSIGDTPLPGDIDGDGKADPGIWRESIGVWIIAKSSCSYTCYLFTQWGQSGDDALPNRPWLP